MSAQNGGLAQLARASGSYPAGRWFKSDIRYHFGSLVKRLRHRPFTAVTGVRFSYESPKRQRTPETVSSVFLMSRRYTNSIAHTLLALSSTNSAFVLRHLFKTTPSAMEFAYAPCAYLANSEHFAQFSTNACLLLNAKTRMANSPTTPPLRCFLFRRWSIAARNSFEHLVPPNTNCTLFCSPGKIPQAECAYHRRWYLASCGEESYPRTERHDDRKHLPA